MPTMADFLWDAKNLLQDDFFLKIDSSPVLLFQKRVRDDSDAVKTFATTRVDLAEDSIFENPTSLASCDVFVVRKRPDASFPSRLGVGRTRSNDICIPYTGISKFHAYIEHQPGTPIYQIADGGSTNGTTVNDLQVPPRGSVELVSGCRIGLGPYYFYFLHADVFYALLRRHQDKIQP